MKQSANDLKVVEKELRRLGRLSTVGIRREMRDRGTTGRTLMSSSCVLANHLRQRVLPGFFFDVASDSMSSSSVRVWVRPAQSHYIGVRGVCLAVPSLHRFICNFDNGFYPELVQQPPVVGALSIGVAPVPVEVPTEYAQAV